MKKIRSIKQLKIEKKRLATEQQQLEKEIICCWAALKENLRPANLVTDTVASAVRKKIKEKEENGSLAKSVISFAASVLANRIADKAGKTLSRLYGRK